jgi:DNA-binding transcriptional LysR family regulator
MNRLLAMEAFVRVVDAGGFSAAARTWGRSKAAVSKYVSQLEEHLAVELLRRTTRSLSLTDAGRAYHRRCADVLEELDALDATVRESTLSLRGTLRITAPPGFASRYLPVMTTDFVAAHPHVALDIDLTHELVDLVEREVDVAIRVTAPRDSALIARKIAPAPIVAVAAPAYLERRGTPRRPSDLARHDCIVDTNFRNQHRWRFHHRGRSETVSVSGPFRVNSPTAVRDLAIAGHGIALTPSFVVTDQLACGDLVPLLRGKIAMNWSIYAVYRRRRYVPARVRAFIDHLAAAFAE